VLAQPRAIDEARDALFLDFDGTLVEIAPMPDAVIPPPGLADELAALRDRLKGALALVSGRPVAEIDGFLAPHRFTVAGLHGRDIRFADGRRERAPVDEETLSSARAVLRAVAERWPGTRLEEKGASVALHYRQAPEATAAVMSAGQAVVASQGFRLKLIPGKMVVEIATAGMDKGMAIRRLAGEASFAGRRPVYAGDDITDEDGFVAVNDLGGLAIRVGPPAATAANAALADVPALHAWLRHRAG
jgi:trehalose 6-phosphate phosphatase